MFFTTVVSIIGSAFMLLFIELKVALACVLVMVVFALVLPKYVRRNDYLYLRLNDRLEKEVAAINLDKFSTLKRHYDIVSRLRVAISNREATSYFIIGVFVRDCVFDDGHRRQGQRGAHLLGSHVSVELCDQSGRLAAPD